MLALLAAVAAAAPRNLLQRDGGDEDCSMVWVTVYADRPTGTTTSVAATASSDVVEGHGEGKDNPHNKVAAKGAQNPSSIVVSASQNSAASASSSPSTAATSGQKGDADSALALPDLPNGEPAIPLTSDHLAAPEDDTPVPAGANVYSPKEAGVFDNVDFAAWLKNLRENPPASKFMKVKPGAYCYKPGPVMPDGTDANTVTGENIVIYLMKGGWTLDLRGVTFYVDVTPANAHQRPGVMIYVLQSENFTLLGGTIWIDQGEQWSQARCTSIDTATETATFEVEAGYNVSAWRAAGPRNQGCVDDSDKSTYKFPGCNFWKVDSYDFSKLDSDRTFTAHIMGGSQITEGVVLVMQVGPNSMITVSTEDNGGLVVKGLTSNGYFMSIGLNGLVPPKGSNIYYVNPPPRPGFAPRVMGPALSWGNIGGFVYDGPDQAKAEFTDSYWQYLAGPKNLQAPGAGKPPGCDYCV